MTVRTKAKCRNCGHFIFRANSKKPWKHMHFERCADVVFFETYAEPEE